VATLLFVILLVGCGDRSRESASPPQSAPATPPSAPAPASVNSCSRPNRR